MVQKNEGDLALLRLSDVLDRVGLRKTKVYALIKEGTFPRPITRFGVSLWVNTEINAYIQQLVASDRGLSVDEEVEALL